MPAELICLFGASGHQPSPDIQDAVADADMGYFRPFRNNRQNGMQSKRGYNLQAMSYEESKYSRNAFVVGAIMCFSCG